MAKRKKQMTPGSYRQGDVYIEAAPIPEDAARVPADNGRTILAAGEATGHHHAMPLAEAAILAKGAQRFLRVEKRSALGHEEHGPIPIPSGTYEITIQREYHPEDVRNVCD